MRKILHIIESSETGGAETIFLKLVCHLDAKRFQPHIGLLYHGWLYDQLIRKGFDPIIFSTNRFFDVKLLSELVKFVKRKNIDLIHSHLFGVSTYASVVGKLCGLPVLSTLHGTVDVDARKTIQRLKFALMNKCSTRVVYVSHSLKKYFLTSGLADPRKSVVVHNGVIIEKYSKRNTVSLRQELGLALDDIVIGSVGDIRPPKGYHVLLRAAKILYEKIPRIRFIIAGSKTPLLTSLIEARDNLGLRHIVRFLGFRDDIPNIFRTMDIFVLPSVSEGFSLSTVEAMAFGLPVIVTKSGGPEEIVTHGENGLLVEKNNPNAISDAILEMISNTAKRSAVIREATLTARKEFSLTAMINKYEKLYLEVLS